MSFKVGDKVIWRRSKDDRLEGFVVNEVPRFIYEGYPIIVRFNGGLIQFTEDGRQLESGPVTLFKLTKLDKALK